MEYKIAIITEADECVASGHLKESIVLLEELDKCVCKTALWLNEDVPKEFLSGVPKGYYTYSRPIDEAISAIISFLKEEGVQLLIFNLREVENELIVEINQACDIEILCIDEFGHRRLDCDIIVNPMIDEGYWQYDGSYKQLLAGNQYLILPQKYYGWHKKDRVINKEVQEITISMGGVDLKNTTQKLVEWLQPLMSDTLEMNVVLGGGYGEEKNLRRILKNRHIHIFRNINFLDELFWNSDLVFCAGGNTLHELACIGTPAVVIPTMPHEYKNGKAFETKGFGKCYQNFAEFEKDAAKRFFSFFDFEERVSQMKAGRSCSDGGGYLRMVNLIKNKITKQCR